MSENIQQESRVKKTLLNAKVNLIFYLLTIVLSFFSRKIFLDCLGADFVGLTGTLQNLLGFLNLAELGIGTAIGYVLYKPLFDNDKIKINEIISVMGYLYRWIGSIVLISGIILACFIPLIFPDTTFSLPLIFLAYFSFLISSLIGYFINYRQNLLGADQRNYVVTAYYQTISIIKIIIQLFVAYLTHSWYLWIFIELFFGIFYSFILNRRINKTYPWLKSNATDGKRYYKKYPEVMRYTKQIFVHQINSFFQFQTTPFLTYAFVSLQTVAYLGNYTLVIDKITNLMNTVLGSVSAGVGNLIAEGNKNKIISIFWEYTTIRVFCAGIIAFACFACLNGLIIVWLGNQYLLPTSVIVLLVIRIYFQVATGSIGPFIYGYGLFADIWASIAQSIIFLVTAIVGGYFFSLDGILFGALLSILIIPGIWKPYYLYSRGFKLSVWKYWPKWIWINSWNILSGIISFMIINYSGLHFKESNFILWLLYSCFYISIYCVISSIFYLLFSSSTRLIIKRFLPK